MKDEARQLTPEEVRLAFLRFMEEVRRVLPGCPYDERRVYWRVGGRGAVIAFVRRSDGMIFFPYHENAPNLKSDRGTVFEFFPGMIDRLGLLYKWDHDEAERQEALRLVGEMEKSKRGERLE